MFGILKLVDHFPIFNPFMVEMFQSDMNIGNVLFCGLNLAADFVDSIFDLLPIVVALLFMRLHKFGDGSFQILKLQLYDTFYALAVQLYF